MAASEGFMPESERVTRQLRDEIIDGVRSPGSRLVERELAESLGVSRLPVREALKILVSEGLVTPRPRSWAVVREFTTSDIADLDEVRSGLETLGFRLAAQRHTREGLERLRATVDAELDAARADDAVRARRAAADFHETVVSLAANELLNELERVLRSRLRWLWASTTTCSPSHWNTRPSTGRSRPATWTASRSWSSTIWRRAAPRPWATTRRTGPRPGCPVRTAVHPADRRGQAITASHVSTPKWTVMPLRP